MCVTLDRDAGAVVAHSLLSSLTILCAAVERAEDGLPLSTELTIASHRQIERLAQFLTMLARGQAELAASAFADAG